MTTTTTRAPRVHNRATSSLYFKHVFSLFDHNLTASIILGLQNELGISAVTLLDFLTVPPDDFPMLEVTQSDEEGVERVTGLTRPGIRLATNIQNWIKYEIHQDKNTDF